jgi:hypothetical protein
VSDGGCAVLCVVVKIVWVAEKCDPTGSMC